MTPDEAIQKIDAGDIRPVYLVTGEETHFVERVVVALRSATVGGGPVGLNEEKLVAGEVDVDRVLSAARTLPMMAKRRLIIIRSLERWDARSSDDDAARSDEPEPSRTNALDRLAAYAESPVSTTCLVLVGSKIDGRRKLVSAARKGGFIVACEPLPRAALPAFILREAKGRGHALDPEVADLLAEIAGPEVARVADAIERLSLYVGVGQPFTEDAVAACLVRMRQSTVWELINAVGRRDLGAALAALDDVYDPRDRGLRLVGLLAWSVRQLVKFDAAVRAGAGPEEAARRAGAPPFKARELSTQLRRISPSDLERWVLLLAESDLELKGSKRPARATVEDALMQMCRPRAKVG